MKKVKYFLVHYIHLTICKHHCSKRTKGDLLKNIVLKNDVVMKFRIAAIYIDVIKSLFIFLMHKVFIF